MTKKYWVDRPGKGVENFAPSRTYIKPKNLEGQTGVRLPEWSNRTSEQSSARNGSSPLPRGTGIPEHSRFQSGGSRTIPTRNAQVLVRGSRDLEGRTEDEFESRRTNLYRRRVSETGFRVKPQAFSDRPTQNRTPFLNVGERELKVSGFMATTPKGMEALLEAELKNLGAESTRIVKGGVAFEGSLATAYRACLQSRIANRVFKPLAKFYAGTPEKLYGGVKQIKWDDHLDVNGTLAIDFAIANGPASSQITHSQYGALKSKDAIVDQFRSVYGVRPSVDTEAPSIRIHIYLNDDMATVSLDLSGQSLHLRGYRPAGALAPLKENLAAALLMAAGWPEKAAAGYSLVDLMCGSGTLVIEGALMALNRAAGIERKYFGFQGWKQHDAALWKKLVNDSMQTEANLESGFALKKGQRIIGTDIDARAVNAALTNRALASLESVVHFEKKSLESYLENLENLAVLGSFGEKGIVIVNPPYGERLGEEAELEVLYKKLGDVLKKRFKGWEAYIFTGNKDLAKKIGLQASKRIVFYNGALECRLLRYELF